MQFRNMNIIWNIIKVEKGLENLIDLLLLYYYYYYYLEEKSKFMKLNAKINI